MDMNQLLHHLGDFGVYQTYIFIVSCLPELMAGIVMLSTVFISANNNHRCFVPDCDSATIKPQYTQPWLAFSLPKSSSSQSFSSCERFIQSTDKINASLRCDAQYFTNITEKCNQFIYDDNEFHSTIVTEWDIVCDDAWKLPLSQSIFMSGVLFGALIFGAFADRFGRRTVFFFAPFLGLISCFLSAMATNFLTFVVCSAVTAACVAGMYQTAFIIGVEFISPKWRVWCANTQQMIFAVGELLLCLMAYYIRDWRDLQFAIALPLSTLLLLPWLLPESVRWQASHGQTYKAIKTISRAAKWNNITIPNEYLFISDESFTDLPSSVNDGIKKHYGPLDLFRNPIIRRWSINLFFNWIVNSLVYYGLSLQASNLGGSTFTTFALLALIEVPAIIIATFAMQSFGRKKVLFFLLAVGGVSCMIPSLIPAQYKWITTILAVFGKSNISASFALIYIYSVEIFPTVLRSTGLGMCSMFSRIGGILAPHLIELSIFGDSVPLLFCGIVSLLAGILTIDLPETHNRPLPETLDDLSELRDGKTISDRINKISQGLIHVKTYGQMHKEEKVHLLSEDEI